jgi:hypothetical protein
VNASSGTDTPSDRLAARPWRRAGWRAEATARIDARLAAAGLQRTGPVQEIKRWTLSAVLACPTTDGTVFYKESHPSLWQEGPVLAALSESPSGLVPAVVSPAPPDQGWCTREVRMHPGTQQPPAARGRALAALAVAQQDWLGRTAELAATGCWDRRSEVLAGLVPTVLRDDILGPESRLPEPLSAAEHARLADACARLPELCAALAAAPPGETLVHGDLHPGNWGVARDDGRTVLLDWAEASVGHPFLDIAAALRSASDPRARTRAQDQCFAAWAPLMSLQECLAVWRFAEPVAVFNQIVTYVRLLDEAEPHERAGWGPRLLWWARHLPDAVDRAQRA